jgi:prolyl-tRNA synthetase
VLAVRDEGDVIERCGAITEQLAGGGVRAKLDAQADVSLGRRATDWELKAAPVRLEVGPRDLAEGVVTMARRVNDGEERKVAVPLDGDVGAVTAELERQQQALLGEATALRESRTVDVSTLDDAREAAVSGWARIPWDAVGEAGEAELAQGGVSVRCLTRADGSLPDADTDPDLVALVARSY